MTKNEKQLRDALKEFEITLVLPMTSAMKDKGYTAFGLTDSEVWHKCKVKIAETAEEHGLTIGVSYQPGINMGCYGIFSIDKED